MNDSETLIYKSNEYYPNNLSYSLSMEGNYSCEFESMKQLINFNYNSSKYFTLVSTNKNTLLFKFKKQSNKSNTISLIIQILFLIITILGLIIFIKRGFKIGKINKKRINNYEE